jgi:hypothetical protein
MRFAVFSLKKRLIVVMLELMIRRYPE